MIKLKSIKVFWNISKFTKNSPRLAKRSFHNFIHLVSKLWQVNLGYREYIIPQKSEMYFEFEAYLIQEDSNFGWLKFGLIRWWWWWCPFYPIFSRMYVIWTIPCKDEKPYKAWESKADSSKDVSYITFLNHFKIRIYWHYIGMLNIGNSVIFHILQINSYTPTSIHFQSLFRRKKKKLW